MTNYFDDAPVQSVDRADNDAHRPAQCPDCGSHAISTLAKIITPDTYWRCAACGMVWNRNHRRG